MIDLGLLILMRSLWLRFEARLVLADMLKHMPVASPGAA